MDCLLVGRPESSSKNGREVVSERGSDKEEPPHLEAERRSKSDKAYGRVVKKATIHPGEIIIDGTHSPFSVLCLDSHQSRCQNTDEKLIAIEPLRQAKVANLSRQLWRVLFR